MKQATSICLLVVALQLVIVLDSPQGGVLAQEGAFELPVQLIGFPVIILAVRLSNFIKKLSYAVNPNTYRARTRRDLLEGPSSNDIDVADVEKRLVGELGQRVCIYEHVCLAYAEEALESHEHNNQIFDWQDIFSKYESSPRGKGEFYLLSVFLGDIVGSPRLCHELAKRGRSCEATQFTRAPHSRSTSTARPPSPTPIYRS
ncbi:hypothetical protein AAG570_011270 [Ranatra chinensis]|uniref:Uncharacterized protein n=1 Tax=Ranatra chinensis TaxID=642074 RepID=A0ABD0YK97_9HEMI